MPTKTEIRLYAGAPKRVCVECPQRLLVRLQHFLGGGGFPCDVARLSSVNGKNGVRGKVLFEVGNSQQQDVKFAVRIFLAANKLEFVERADGAQTIFHLAGKGSLRSGK